jgi:hypothetical protein
LPPAAALAFPIPPGNAPADALLRSLVGDVLPRASLIPDAKAFAAAATAAAAAIALRAVGVVNASQAFLSGEQGD